MPISDAFVSELCGKPVVLASDPARKTIGKVADIAVNASAPSFPPVTGLYVRGNDRVLRYAPYPTVADISQDAVRLSAAPLDASAAPACADELLLRKDLLDKQIVDVDGRKVVRVNDAKLAAAADGLRLIAADVGLSGLLRRIGLPAMGRRWLERARGPGLRQALISWDAVQPLRHDGGSAPIRLRVPQDRIDRIHPADLAAIIAELNASDQASLIGSLDEETAADALEQLDVDTQLSIIEDLAPDRAADIIENMEPDDAADLLAEVEPEKKDELLSLMEPAEASDVRSLLTHGEQTAGGLMTTAYLWVPPELSVAQVFEHIRAAAEDAELAYYVYVLQPDGHIAGVLSLRDLITAQPDAPIRSIMNDDVVTVALSASREEVATTIARYDFVAVPVVDAAGRIQGIVTVDDVIDVLLPEKLRRMLPRVGRSRSRAKT
jgi:CBS domain-containing protein